MKPSEIAADPDYALLKERIVEGAGLAYYADKDDDLSARFSRRLSAAGVRNCREYLRILGGPAGDREMAARLGEVAIGETHFFRQTEAFQALRHIVFPDLIARKAALRQLRIWSAGCSNGAEPYSVAMLLREPGFEQIAGWDVSILGTDVSEKLLAQAREARYDDWAFREPAAEEAKKRCFVREGKRWALRAEYARGVSFRFHNLVADSLPGDIPKFDLILCRNVMIYFSPAAIRATVERFHGRLADGGYLLVGHAEPNVEVFKEFETIMAGGATLYRKKDGESAAQIAPVWSSELPPMTARSGAPSGPGSEPETVISGDAISVPTPSLSEARALADRGEWEGAAECCRRVLEADSLNPSAHFTLALILEHAGAREAAEQALKRAIYLDRAFAPAHYHLGLLLHARDAGQAAKSFRNVLEITGAKPAAEVLEHADGMTAGELRDLANLHLEMLGR